MNVHTNIPLKNYLTMKLGGSARFMTDVSTADELAAACRNAKSQNLPFFVLGGGSNVIATDNGFNGLVIRNRIPGFDVLEDTASGAIIKIGAGEDWDETVAKTVQMGLSGIEAMSAIPGTVGAAPVQNIGAYGQELAETFVSLEAYDSETDQFVILENADCGFSYRHSIFRGEQSGRYAICSVTLKLFKSPPQPPFYEAVERYFNEHGITLFTAANVRDAVIAIRSEKLPDPSERPNTGSFFKNAIIDDWQLTELQKNWPDIPYYELDGKQVKIPTGWLIEQVGLKGQLLHGMRVHDKNALVLINESAASYSDLAAARDEIMAKVRDTFRITIEQEPLQV
ncbi:MAG TPA: UDP-N-acetylmuramate dehydrogenase [Candidatus Saccharibacteria bacterium]|nr:UDP-N-acetylmuramate dehydrogenase [Candidatus Saccharibacteria bacterium]HRK93928.1 UDP-N-acetylmuramate dehydrogenase [Candidatus Saccharibacteria bacterium]